MLTNAVLASNITKSEYWQYPLAVYQGALGHAPCSRAAALEAALIDRQIIAAADGGFSGRPMHCAPANRQLMHHRCAAAPVTDVPVVHAKMAGMASRLDDDLAPSAPAADFDTGWRRPLYGAARPAGVFWLRPPPPGQTRTAPRPP